MAINAIAADAREPSRKALAKTSGIGTAMMEEYSRAYAVLVACRAANCIDQIVLLAMAPCRGPGTLGFSLFAEAIASRTQP
jgi:hypothetical protein